MANTRGRGEPTRVGDPLTPRQCQVYQFIRDYLLENEYPPTVREMMAQFGIGSPNAMVVHLRAIEKKGLIRRRPKSARAIRLTGTPDGEGGEGGEAEDATLERGGPAAPTRDASAPDASPPTAYHARLIARARRVASLPDTARDAAALLAELAEALEGRRDG